MSVQNNLEQQLKAEIYDLSKQLNHVNSILNRIAESLGASTLEDMFAKLESLKARPEVEELN